METLTSNFMEKVNASSATVARLAEEKAVAEAREAAQAAKDAQD